MGLSLTGAYWLQKRNIEQSALMRVEGTKKLMEGLLSSEVRVMQAQMEYLAKDKSLQAAFVSGNRPALRSLAQPILSKLHKKYGITHFYFITPQKRAFLRTHNPDKHGDTVGHFTLNTSTSTGRPDHGLELGKFGTFTLRAVRPWYIDGELAGYLELGMEIEHITRLLKEYFKHDVVVLIRKKFLNRSRWEAGLKLLNKTGQWNQFADLAVIDKTMEVNPDIAAEITNLCEQHPERTDQSFSVTVDGRYYFAAGTKLFDKADRDVGLLLCLIDSTRQYADLKSFMGMLALAVLTVGGALLCFFYFYIGGIGKRLDSTYTNLVEEIKARQRTSKELAEHKEHLENLVEKRTEALRASILDLEQEIIERKNTEQALRESEERFRTLFNEAADIMFVHGLDGAILDVNQRACETLGYSREELLELSIPDVLGEDISEEELKDVWNKVRANQLFPVESLLKRKDGGTTPIEVHLARLNLNNRPMILAISRDLSERKRAEEDKLARGKLQAAVETAGAVCHELNQPMQTITSLSEFLIVKNFEPDSLSHNIETILLEINRMAEITRRLQNLTKYETKTYVGETKILNIEESSK